MKLKFTTVFKKASNGKLHIMRYEVSGNKYRCHTGYAGGAVKTGEWRECEGKNIGRANETTPEEQAQFEAESKMRKYVEQAGYRFSAHAAMHVVEKFPRVVLANSYKKGMKLEFPKFIQAKLNGFRGPTRVDGIFTRRGKNVVSCPHIREQLEQLFNIYPDALIDGELYNHDIPEALEDISSLVRKQKPTAKDLEASKSIVRLYVYNGYLSKQDKGKSFKDRFNAIIAALAKLKAPSVFIVPVVRVDDYSEIDTEYFSLLDKKYEGAMLLDPEAPYSGKRGNSILKYKPRWTDEFRITGAEEGVGKNKSVLSRFIAVNEKTRTCEGSSYESPKGMTFKVNIKGTIESRKKMFAEKEKYIGKKVTVSYAYCTKRGVPWHNYLEKVHFKEKI